MSLAELVSNIPELSGKTKETKNAETKNAETNITDGTSTSVDEVLTKLNDSKFSFELKSNFADYLKRAQGIDLEYKGDVD